MTHKQFVDKWNGRYADWDKKWGFQCVDLVRFYINEVHGFNPYKALPAGPTAKAIFQNFKTNAYYTKILNSPNNVPKQGDLVFWGTYPFVSGWAGHVAIFDSGDLYTVISFDQNYPSGSRCRLYKHGSGKILHGYRGVMGWLRKK